MLFLYAFKEPSESEGAWGLLGLLTVLKEAVPISPNPPLDLESTCVGGILMDGLKALPQVLCLVFGLLML